MSRLATLEHETLSWVKKELDAVLDQARQALEGYIDNPDDAHLLTLVREPLRQAGGTLQMVELYGAAMLAEEMEEVTHALVNGVIRNREEAFEVLLRAILQLPDYLEHIQAGNRDVPIVLLPLLNDLRTARDASLLSEKVLFFPDSLSAVPDGSCYPSSNFAPDVRAAAKRLRHIYQVGLLGWFRSQDARGSLDKLKAVSIKLYEVSHHAGSRRLWRTTAALAEALSLGALEPNVTVKSLLGRVDREIKRLGDRGEEEFAANIPEELSKNILYYVAYADGRSEFIKEVKQAYGLNDLLPHGEALKEVRERIAGPNVVLLNTVSEAIREDLAVVRDNLELFVSGGDKDVGRLEPVVHKLRTTADTLNMLGLGHPAAKMAEQAGVAGRIVRREIDATEAILTDIASVVLDVEIAVNNFAAGRAASIAHAEGEEGAPPPAAAAVAGAEHRRLLAAVMAEALRDLERVKDAINDFIRAPGEPGQLRELPAFLERINGAVAITHCEHAPELLASISGYASSRLCAGQAMPNAGELESLADAITAVEYILGSLGKGANVPVAILEVGRASVGRLGFPVDTPPIDASQHARENPSGWTAINAAFTALYTGGQSDTARVSRADPGATEIYAPSLSAEPAAKGSAASRPGEEPVATQSHSAMSTTVTPEGDRRDLVPLTGEADEEILQVFIEEAEEQLDLIERLLPKWHQDAGDQDSLTTIRRSFHTLKGSGRLVGAQLLGEFAWAFENLLNRVLDGTLPAAEHIHEALRHAPEGLAQLIVQIGGGGAPVVDVFALMDAVHAMSKADYRPRHELAQRVSEYAADGDALGTSAGETAGAAQDAAHVAERQSSQAEHLRQTWSLDGAFASEPSSAEAKTDGKDPERAGPDDVTRVLAFPAAGSPAAFEVEEISLCDALPASEVHETELVEVPPAAAESEPLRDPVLLDIFINEAEQHVRVLESRLHAAAGQRAGLPVTDELLRALHTLNGSARTADVPEIARLCAPLEHYAAARATSRQPVSRDAVALLQQASAVVRGILQALRKPGTPQPSNDDLQTRIEALLREEVGPQTAPPHARSVSDSVDVLIRQGEEDQDAGAVETVAAQPASSVSGPEPPAKQVAEANEPFTEPPNVREANEIKTLAAAETVAPGTDQDRELVEIFLEEARGLIDASDNCMQRWQANQEDEDAVNDLQRHLHTLKGGARMAGAISIGDLSHALESVIISVVEGRTALSPSLFDATHRGFDRLHAMLEQAQKFEPITPAPDVIGMLDDVRQGRATNAKSPADSVREPDRPQLEQGAPVVEAAAPAPPGHRDEARSEAALEPPADVVRAARTASRAGAQQELVRVNSQLLDNLVNSAGEVNIYHSRLEQQITGFRFNLKELEQTVARLRDQLRKLEIETEAQILFRYEQERGEQDEPFDPLELDRYSAMQQLSRALGESVNDLISIKEILVDQVRDSETLLLQQSRVSTDLQEGLMRTRMVQFAGTAPRLRRIARQTASELKKKVALHISGESNELDRSVLDRMVAPLEHMLRNAISHGIETPDERLAKGKPEMGRVRVSVAREANEVVVKVEDDGGGVNLEAVRVKARELGMISGDDKLSSHDIMQFILEAGFSTAREVTQISGRGVGMDVVNSEIKQLGGVLSIDSTLGKGTSFTVRLPFTLAISQALLVQSGDDIYAVPFTSIEGVVRLSGDELKRKYAEGGATYQYAGNVYELRHLGALLGRSEPVLAEAHAVYPMMLVKSGDRRVALQVEGLLGNREVVVKTVGPQISKVRGISGATILGDGRVVLILDLASLVRVGFGAQTAYRSVVVPGGGTAREKAVTVMVVDDSITIRKVTSRMLERNNFAVLTAKDGVDAVSQLQDNVPDLLLLDIEMPRMDGYELATYIRNNEHLREIPIIMITSRTGEKHRQRAMEIGVDRYLGKPYQEVELLNNINEVLARRGAYGLHRKH